MATVTFPIVSGQRNVPDPWFPITITVTNTSGANPASVSITRPDGSELWACTLAPSGTATFNQAIRNENPEPAGVYTVTVTGAVVGQVTR